jgi:hypothetical protein
MIVRALIVAGLLLGVPRVVLATSAACLQTPNLVCDAGDTMTGALKLNGGGLMVGGTGSPEGDGFVSFTAKAVGSCGAGEYWVQADSGATKLRACENGTLYDLAGPDVYDTSGIVEGEVKKFTFTSGDFAVTSSVAGEVEIELGTNATELGSTIGNVGTEFADPTIMPFDIIGGTTGTSVLSLKGSNASSQTTAAIELCADTPSVTGTWACATLAPGGVTLGANSALAIGLGSSGFTATQTTDALAAGILPGIYGFNVPVRLKVTDSGINGSSVGALRALNFTGTVTNETDDNYAGGSAVGLSVALAGTKTSTGTLTLATVDGITSSMTAPGTGVTYTTVADFHANDYSGTVDGTSTRHFAFLSEALSKGTAGFPFGAGKRSALLGTPPTGYAAWGVETGVTSDADRFVTKNAAGHGWRMGYLTFTGRGTGLATSAGTNYFPVFTSATDDATETNVDAGAPGAMTCYSLACGLNVAAGGGSDAHAITLRDDTADTALACTITTTASSCSDREEAGVSIAAPSLLAYKNITADTPTANEITCTLVCNLNAW